MIDFVNVQPQKITESIQPKNISAAEVSDQFGKFLNEAMANLNDQQAAVDKLNEGFVKGEISTSTN